MKFHSDFKCKIHQDEFDCPDVLINYISKFDEYGIIIHDGGNSSITISFCPWCGKNLPESKRDLWYDTLEKLGFENPSDDEIPKEFLSHLWFTKNKI